MTRIALTWVALSLALTTLGCSSSDKTAQSQAGGKTLAEALTQGVMFAHGLIKKGAIGSASAAARKVALAEAKALALKPGTAALMPLDVDNPDESDNAVNATLMQFSGSDSHIEVPAKYALAHADGGAGDADAGSDAGTSADTSLHLEHAFDVDPEICKGLCNKRYQTEIEIAVVLADGSISKHQARSVTLDCSDDGDPKLCSKDDRDAGNPSSDAGTSSTGGDSGTGDSGGSDAGVTRSGDGGLGNGGLLAALTPANTTAGTALTLMIAGSGFAPGATVYVDDVAADTTFVSDTEVDAKITAQNTQEAGSLAIYVENVPGDASTSSNVLYLQVDPAAGAPLIYDYSPDNGVAGDKILIIASNLAGQTLDITDSSGRSITAGALSTISWPTAGTADTVEITLPKGIETGPITVANDKGSFKGKIFSVGSNLTRLSGTTLDSSTQFNDTNWSRASGGDNLLATSFFTANGDCATDTSCTTQPWFEVTFPSDQTVARIAIRGNREYASGYDFLRAKFAVLDSGDSVLWQGSYDLPAPDRDLDLVLPSVVKGARKVKFTSLADESTEPGFSELEVFGP